jgi:ABC-type branched-subunit amino acid transport system substrate-binding protein
MKAKRNRNLRFTWSICAVSLLVFSFSLGLATVPAPAAEKVLKVGHVCGLTGPQAIQRALFEGRSDMFDFLNSRGGIKGVDKVEVLWADTQYQLPVEVAAYKKFVGEGIKLFFPVSTGGAVELKGIAERHGVPLLRTGGSYGERMNPGWAYYIWPSYAEMNAALVDWYVKHMWKKPTPPKMAEIVTNTGYGRECEASFDYLKGKGIELVYKAYVEPSVMDLTPQITAAKAAGANLLVGNNLAQDCRVLLRDIKRLGFDKDFVKIVPWVFGDISGYPEVLTEGSGWNIGAVQVLLPDIEGQKGLGTISKELKDFIEKKRGKVPSPTMYWAANIDPIAGYKAIELAIKKVGFEKLDGRAVAEQLERLEVSENEFFGLHPKVSATPGKRGMTRLIIPVAYEKGKLKALDGWIECPNLW